MGMPFKMGGRQADENLPEVVQQPLMASASPMPEVVSNSSPEFAQQRYMERDKIPVYYDTAPKFPHEPQTPAMRSLSYQNQQPWNDAELSIGMLSPNSSLPWQSFHPYDDQQTYVGSEPPEPEKLICGLRKRPFIIIAVIIALVVVGAAVGGAVGGSMAARQGSSGGVEPAETSSASSSSATSSSSTTTTSTTPTPSSTTSSGPSLPTPSISFLWNQTDETYEGYAFQAYEKNDFEGKASLILWEEGFFDLGFDSTSWIWIPNGLDACVTFCASKTEETGYACMPRRRNATKNNISFKRVHIWRGAWNKDGTVEEMSKKCS